MPASKWRLLGIRKKSPPQKKWQKRSKNRVRTGICAQNTSIFLGHPSPSLHFWVFHLHPPLKKKIKKFQKYIYFLESEVSPPKISHTPPLGVFLTPSLSVQLEILPYLCYTRGGGGAEEYIFISGLYSPNFLVHSSKSLDNKSL